MKSLSTIVTIFFTVIFLISGVESHEITVTNRCPQVLWIGTYGENDTPAGGGFRLDIDDSKNFPIIDGWKAGRVWGKTGCDDNGQNCVTGNSNPGDRTYLLPVTLAEFQTDGWAGQDYYDISLVDGFNLPMTIQPYGSNPSEKCKSVNCYFDFNVCPEEFRQYGDSGTVIACKSACSATQKDEYCCPKPPYDETSCYPSRYSEIFKNQCPDAFSYAFDEPTSTWVCQGQGQSSSGYEVIFCP